LEIPCFIKDSMVTRCYNAGVKVEVGNVLISSSIAQENACEVVAIEFDLASPSAFHAYTRSKGLQVCDVGLASIPAFVGSFVYGQMNKPVVQIHGV
jgi:hypothetical protein